MSTVQRIAKNTSVLLAAQVAGYLLAFFYMMYTARYLGAAGFGILSFALAFTGIFAVFGDLGLRPLTVREVARDKSLAPKYLANVSLMKIILVAVTFGLIALTINLMGYPEETIKVVYLLALFVIFQAFAQMFYSIFQAFERMEYQAIGQMLNAALILSGVTIAIKHGFSVVGFASLYVIASIIVLGYSFTVMKLKFSNPVPASAVKIMEFDWSFWEPTIKEALPFGLASIFISIYYWIDTVMLSLMQGSEVVGWYNAAYRLIIVLLALPSMYFLSIFPVTSRFYKSSEESLKFAHERTLKYMTIIAIPLGVGTTLLADKIILVIFGIEYIPAIIALQILIWSLVFIFISVNSTNLLYSINKQRFVMKVTAVCAVANIALNLFLIPRYSYVGASIATVATECIAFCLIFYWISRSEYKLSSRSLLRTTSKVIIASLIMGMFIKYFTHTSLLALVPLSVILYFGIFYALRGLDKADILIFRSLIRKG